MEKYDYYNREERAICAHLFRLLHERLDDKAESPFGQFIFKLFQNDLTFRNGDASLLDTRFENLSIFCEVSIIRDAYYNAKPDINPFMDDLVRLIMKQENVHKCRLYSDLPKPLNNIKETHPKQIRQKATTKNIDLTEEESKVYGALQGMFNAKPDLVLTMDNVLLVCEAKFTEPFNDQQMKRTRNIAEVWATLLYKDLGFVKPPVYTVFKLGYSKFKPHINWTQILEIAEQTYSVSDRTRVAIKAGVELLKRREL